MSELVIENVSYSYKNADRLALSLSIMAGLDRPEEGRVLLDGVDLAGMDLDAYRRQDVSVIFQAFQLFPLLTVMENVCYPMELNEVALKDAKERAKTLLSSVGRGLSHGGWDLVTTGNLI